MLACSHVRGEHGDHPSRRELCDGDRVGNPRHGGWRDLARSDDGALASSRGRPTSRGRSTRLELDAHLGVSQTRTLADLLCVHGAGGRRSGDRRQHLGGSETDLVSSMGRGVHPLLSRLAPVQAKPSAPSALDLRHPRLGRGSARDLRRSDRTIPRPILPAR